MKNQPQYVSFITFTANGVKIICLAFNKLSVFRFEAKINSTFFKFLVANFKHFVFSETIKSVFQSQTLVLTTGSNSKIWALLKRFGHTIIDAVPSLFTFKIEDERISNIPGVVVNHVVIKVKNSDLMSEGPLLITHVGMSAPAILKLSSFGAIEFAKRHYKFKIEIIELFDWEGCRF